MLTYWLHNKIVSRVIVLCIPQITEIIAYDNTNLNSLVIRETKQNKVLALNMTFIIKNC